jgi:hypothetical protein
MKVAKFSLKRSGDEVEIGREALDFIFANMPNLGWDRHTLTLQTPYFLRAIKPFEAGSIKVARQLFRLRRLCGRAGWDDLSATFYDPADEKRVRHAYSDAFSIAVSNEAANSIS